MSLASTVTIANGAAAAATAAGTPVVVTPGATITVALSSTTSVVQWSCRVDTTELAALGGMQVTQTTGYTFSFVAPQGNGLVSFSSETTDGQNVSQTKFYIQVQQVAALPDRSVRGVATGNVATPTAASAFTVASNDGLTFVQGDRVLLASQTTKAENGIYVVGAVATGTAALSRPADYATGMVLPLGLIVDVNAGTLFANTQWRITTAGAVTVDTTSHDFYPQAVTTQVVLSSGTVAAITTIPVLSATKSNVAFQRIAVSGTLTTFSMYTVVPAWTIGIAGTASIVPMSVVAAGTILNTDNCTVNMTVTNW